MFLYKTYSKSYDVKAKFLLAFESRRIKLYIIVSCDAFLISNLAVIEDLGVVTSKMIAGLTFLDQGISGNCFQVSIFCLSFCNFCWLLIKHLLRFSLESIREPLV